MRRRIQEGADFIILRRETCKVIDAKTPSDNALLIKPGPPSESRVRACPGLCVSPSVLSFLFVRVLCSCIRRYAGEGRGNGGKLWMGHSI